MKKLVNLLTGPGLGASLVRASIGSAGLRIAGMGFGFLLTIQLARALGPAAYGVYGAAMAVLAILTAASEFGMSRIVVREIAAAELSKDWPRIRGVLAWSRRTALAISLAAVAAIVIWAWLAWDSDPVLLLTLLVGAAWVPVVTLANLDAGALAGLRRFIEGQISEVLLRPAFFSLALFAIALLSVPLTPVWAMALGVASAALSYCTCAILLRRNLPVEVRREQSSTRSPDWFRSAIPIALSEGVRVGQAHLTILILAALAADTITGNYRAAASIFVLFALPESMLNLVTGPVIARLLSQGDRPRLQRLLSWTAAAGSLLTLVLVCPFLIFGEDFLVLLLGEAFREASGPLAILSIGMIFTPAAGPGLVLMNMAGHDREVLVSGAIALLVLVLIAPPLILWTGANGAAGAFSFSFFLWRLLVRQRAVRLLNLDPSLVSLGFALRR